MKPVSLSRLMIQVGARTRKLELRGEWNAEMINIDLPGCVWLYGY